MARPYARSLGAELGEALGFDANKVTRFTLRYEHGDWLVDLTSAVTDEDAHKITSIIKRYELVERDSGEV